MYLLCTTLSPFICSGVRGSDVSSRRWKSNWSTLAEHCLEWSKEGPPWKTLALGSAPFRRRNETRGTWPSKEAFTKILFFSSWETWSKAPFWQSCTVVEGLQLCSDDRRRRVSRVTAAPQNKRIFTELSAPARTAMLKGVNPHWKNLTD